MTEERATLAFAVVVLLLAIFVGLALPAADRLAGEQFRMLGL